MTTRVQICCRTTTKTVPLLFSPTRGRLLRQTRAIEEGKLPSQDAPLTYISYEANCWEMRLKASGARVLVDPWLVGTLTFGGLDFVFSGSKRKATPERIDVDGIIRDTNFVLITMSIDDHCHKPTLDRIPRKKPIVASPSAAKVVREMGFTEVYELDHEQSVTLMNGAITIKATEGALVGPPWSKREVGFVVRENVDGGISLYYEPHADYEPSSVSKIGHVDVVVSPPCTQSLLGYDLVKGTSTNIPLLSMLKPQAVVALLNAEFDATGPLNALIQETGSPELLKKELSKIPDLRNVRICVPEAGVPLEVNLS